jgi:sterol-4alpha-carboxylate 3-dehydrogenase (decarboxylating)
MKAIRGNKTHFQVGNNDKLFDFTYVTNVAQALVLASDKLTDPPLDPEALNASLSTVYQTRKVPTSEAAPLGPNLSPSAEALASAKAFEKEPEWRPIVRSKFDPLTTKALQLEEGNPLQVAGNVFFITNGQPVYFWDLARTICKELGFPPATKITKVPKSVMMYVAGAMEWWGWITRSEPELTRFRVVYTCCNRWYNIEKARRVLGYYPEVELEEGIKKMGEVSLLFNTFYFASS